MRNLECVTDEECYEIAVLEGWKYCWEMDDLEDGITRDSEELYNALVERGRDIITGEISGIWVNYERVNGFLSSKGYLTLNAL
jgi:hypothetical protein